MSITSENIYYKKISILRQLTNTMLMANLVLSKGITVHAVTIFTLICFLPPSSQQLAYCHYLYYITLKTCE